MENQKDWQEGQLRIKRRTSSTASFARVSEWSRNVLEYRKADRGADRRRASACLRKVAGPSRKALVSERLCYASCDLASSISRAACAQDDPSLIRYARNSGSLSVSANRTHSPARFKHSCGSLIMATSCGDQRSYVTTGGIPNEFELVTKATYFARRGASLDRAIWSSTRGRWRAAGLLLSVGR